jgi:arsenate reductase (thioredoxin)
MLVPMPKPTVLLVCTHDAGRSQMAAGWLQHLAGDTIDVLSGGFTPADAVNPGAVEAMAEAGIHIASQRPRLWSDDDVDAADVVVIWGAA